MGISRNNQQITDARKEATAITVMRTMLTSYSEDNNIPFEQAMLDFSKSKTYCDLFDYSTDIWKEGPIYLKALYIEELTHTEENIIQSRTYSQ